MNQPNPCRGCRKGNFVLCWAVIHEPISIYLGRQGWCLTRSTHSVKSFRGFVRETDKTDKGDLYLSKFCLHFREYWLLNHPRSLHGPWWKSLSSPGKIRRLRIEFVSGRSGFDSCCLLFFNKFFWQLTIQEPGLGIITFGRCWLAQVRSWHNVFLLFFFGGCDFFIRIYNTFYFRVLLDFNFVKFIYDNLFIIRLDKIKWKLMKKKDERRP